MEGNEKKNIKQKKKEEKRKVATEDQIRIKKNIIVSKLDKIEESIDDVMEYIEKNRNTNRTKRKNKNNFK